MNKVILYLFMIQFLNSSSWDFYCNCATFHTIFNNVLLQCFQAPGTTYSVRFCIRREKVMVTKKKGRKERRKDGMRRERMQGERKGWKEMGNDGMRRERMQGERKD